MENEPVVVQTFVINGECAVWIEESEGGYTAWKKVEYLQSGKLFIVEHTKLEFVCTIAHRVFSAIPLKL